MDRPLVTIDDSFTMPVRTAQGVLMRFGTKDDLLDRLLGDVDGSEDEEKRLSKVK